MYLIVHFIELPRNLVVKADAQVDFYFIKFFKQSFRFFINNKTGCLEFILTELKFQLIAHQLLLFFRLRAESVSCRSDRLIRQFRSFIVQTLHLQSIMIVVNSSIFSQLAVSLIGLVVDLTLLYL